MRKKIRITFLTLTPLLMLLFSGCGQKYNQYIGQVQGVDLEHQILYIVSTDEGSPFTESCGVVCTGASERNGIMALDADDASLNLREIAFGEIREGDTVEIYLDDAQVEKASSIHWCEAYQVQLERRANDE